MAKNKEKKAGKRMKKKDLVNILMNFFHSKPTEALSLKFIFSELKMTTHPLKMLCIDILNELKDGDYITEVDKNKFRLNDHGKELTGTFQRKSNGKNSFIPDEGGDPIFIAERNSAHAMNNDKVKIVFYAKRKNHDAEGEVVEILERANDTFVGTLEVANSYAFLVTENRTLANDIFIPKEKLKGGKTGDKAVVKIVEWPDKAKNPIGQVIDILGKAGDNTTEMHAILAEFGLPYVYPEAVEKAADKIPAEISEEEIARREDFRKVTTFTIDPKDAKDFDDALSIRSIKEGLWEVGVHIADVTHYVQEGSIIDKEAEKRATSVYLVDRTIPMLPERLCNFICSLRPNEEKLSYSVIFDITEKGEVKNSRIVHTVINSDRRFTYEEAQQIIETKEGDFKEEVLMLDKIAKALRDKRFSSGAINFDRYEVKFEIDDKGKPVSVYFKESKDANKLVEEFMLLANKTVAEEIGKVPRNKKAKVFPYRIHDLPDPEKLDNLAQFIARFGYKLRTSGTKSDVSKSINHLLDDIQGKKEENLIETVSIRAMQKARYSTHNIGHYGLAFEYYTHFTSPIRRFPDMMVHRLLTKYAEGGRSVLESKYEDLCEHSSNMEQIAANAERASIKYKQVEFMSERLGQIFDGVISGVTEWGLYVELNENKCEGMIPMRDLDDDYYEFDEKNYCLRGRRKNRMYSLGDAITVKVARANLEKKQLDFALVEEKR
ncbi:MAG: ribonuclease R [Bacteroides graminisolvens]|jgi:ribonuclease R|uniref:ribonuclease R n=1 Tax=Bacteroides TaxID=816 RepID=UPI001B4F75E0|nr:ribonuclease R [Bacteroides graminisolvens]MBP5978147.1 ribonuclease R [Bacteroides sp.]MBP9495129.1 ribonuclease R [Bacteroides sp.]MBP9552730.1 ribonuclease R [Bacteroides sp.]MBP9719672.1 ribonuclease R [Bacteroides sp.]MCD8474232.1 ribonuclease R [Bacteroides graminisolvens]